MKWRFNQSAKSKKRTHYRKTSLNLRWIKMHFRKVKKLLKRIKTLSNKVKIYSRRGYKKMKTLNKNKIFLKTLIINGCKTILIKKISIWMSTWFTNNLRNYTIKMNNINRSNCILIINNYSNSTTIYINIRIKADSKLQIKTNKWVISRNN